MIDWGGMVQMEWIAFGVVVAIGFAIGTVVGWLLREWLGDHVDKWLSR